MIEVVEKRAAVIAGRQRRDAAAPLKDICRKAAVTDPRAGFKLCTADKFCGHFLNWADHFVKEDRTTDRDRYEVGDQAQLDAILADFNTDYVDRFIILSGTLGSGKSAVLKILANMFRNTPYYMTVISERRIVELVNEFGYKAMKAFLTGGLAIDDIGTTSGIVNYYKNDIDIIDHIMCTRYERGLFTVGTTNLNRERFLKRLPQRLRDRVVNRLAYYPMTGVNYREPLKNYV